MAKGIYIISTVSAIIGGLLVAASSILVKELKLAIDACQGSEEGLGRDQACNPIYADVGASGLGILAGLTQVIICIVVIVNRGRISRHTGLATHSICFVMCLIAFSVSMGYSRSHLIKVLKNSDEGWGSRLSFFYAMTGIAWAYALGVVLAIKLTPRKIPAQPNSITVRTLPAMATYTVQSAPGPSSNGLQQPTHTVFYNTQPYPQISYNTQPIQDGVVNTFVQQNTSKGQFRVQ